MAEVTTKQTLYPFLDRVEGWLSHHEAILLYELAKKVSAQGEIVEIGSYKGKSTIALASGLYASKKLGKIWAIDPHEGIIKEGQHFPNKKTFNDFKKNIQTAGVESLVQPVVETSRKAAKEWNQPIRLLFLDGLHDYQHTVEDYRIWSPWVVKGGVIAFHDGFCGEAGVWKVIHSHVFHRKDIVDIGTVSSILYVILGTPTLMSKLRVKRKKRLIQIAMMVHTKRIPWLLKKFGIHVAIRMLLLTKYTIGVYKKI